MKPLPPWRDVAEIAIGMLGLLLAAGWMGWHLAWSSARQLVDDHAADVDRRVRELGGPD